MTNNHINNHINNHTKEITEMMEFLGQMRVEESEIAAGFNNAYGTLCEAAFTATSLPSLIEVVGVLERHAMDDLDKPYMVCYGEREFYQRANKLFKGVEDDIC